MDDEIARLRQLLEDAENRALEEQRRREEEQRRREEEQRRREEEQRRREEAEKQARASQPQTLPQYLDACHSLSLAINIMTDPSSTTQGDTTNPTGRIFPRRIVPWDSFAARQEEIWDKLLDNSFGSRPAFPSSHQLDYVALLNRPISSEIGLRNFERDTVENAVQILVEKAHSIPPLRDNLGLRGTVTFESHTNLGKTGDMSESIEHMSVSDDARAVAPDRNPTAPKAHHKTKRKGNLADQFCIYRTSDGRNVPALAIEYKAPHKLTRDEIVTGLEFEIQPGRDVINKDGEGFIFASRSLAAAVVTQLFSYMIGKGIQYGYVCTGEAFVFMYVPDDPTVVYYSVCVPNLDVLDGDETRLHRTAVAQVFAFVLQALRAAPPPQSWHDKAESLDTWAVEYDDVLRNIPPTVRKERRASPYKPQRWKGFARSPIRTRARCKQADISMTRRDNDDDDDDDDDEGPPSPTANRSSRPDEKAVARVTGSGGKRARRGRGGGQQGQGRQEIQDRLFCTQECLLGLARGGPLDKSCPNFLDHRRAHLDRPEFLRLVRAQLAEDRGPNADCVPLYLSGRRGSLFKVRLSSSGYTLVAKGVEQRDLHYLSRENKLYDRLEPVQGKHVPVCLGRIDLVLPYYHDGGVFGHFLFLSYAGRPLLECNGVSRADIVNSTTTAFQELHKLGVLHRDAEPRNLLYDTRARRLMAVDFERSEVRERQPLGPISPNSLRKRKRGQKRGGDDFAEELRHVVGQVSRCLVREELVP